MSASFPPVPGFAGPFSLKAFLERFFSLNLTFGSKSPRSRGGTAPDVCSQGSTSRRVDGACASVVREVTLPVNESFLVVVYVALHAPAAPPLSDPTEAVGGLFCSPRSSSASGGSSSTTRPRSCGDLSWLLYTRTTATHRPFTNAVLRHPWWLSFASLLGPAGVAFVELYCPVLVQLEVMAGGVQVLGPALQHAVPLALCPPIAKVGAETASPSSNRRRREKRLRDDAKAEKQQNDAVQASVRKQHRTEILPPPSAPQQHVESASQKGSRANLPVPAGAAWAASLVHADVSRGRLCGAAAKHTADESAMSVGSSAEDGAQPIPASFLEALWVAQHPSALRCAMHAALPRWQALRAERLTRDSHGRSSGDVEQHLSAPLRLPFCYVRHVFRWMDMRPPACSHDAPLQPAAKPQRATAFDVGGHLQHVLSSVFDQCRRLDLRGAALKHTRYLEERWQRQQQGQEVSDLQQLAAPVDVVVAYLRTLLSSLQWLPCEASLPRCKEASLSLSFWGVEEGRSGGGTRVLDALCTALRAWLMAGRHAAFPVSRFLTGVPVAQLPWLRGFYTCSAPSSSPSAQHHARRQRSQIQQRVWLQFVLFLTQDVLPFLLRSAFAVTWSSKNPHQFLFFPAAVWRRVVRCELRRAVHRGGSLAAAEGSAEARPRLCRVAASPDLDAHEAATTLFHHDGRPALLYAGVRFRPDGKKLRPIAVMRSASPRAIRAMARGTPSPYCHSAAVLRLLGRLCTTGTTTLCGGSGGSGGGAAVPLPPSTHEAVEWIRRKSGFRRAPSKPVRHAQPPHKAALRNALQCLVSGVEEQQVRSGLPQLNNLSHRDEYAELRSFCEAVTGVAHRESGDNAARAAAGVFLVRSDASRCYDNLPQTRVLAEAEALLAHDAYCTLSFTAIYGAAPHGSSSGTCTLRRVCVQRTVPHEALDACTLSRIPRGHILWEEERRESKRATCSTASPSKSPTLDSSAVRAFLRAHVQRQLVVLDGKLFEQAVGILQGSPVAMLLCDHVLATAVDTSLSHILSEHEERSLVLRRVDDVLVATTSAVAAQRCLQSMQRGWPAVGYQSNPKKLTLSAQTGKAVPWCGLLIDDTTLETSVEWQRMAPLLPSLLVADTRSVHVGDREPLLFTQRLLAVVQLRVPPTALCHRINSRTRQLQTFYEAALLWSRLTVGKVQAALYSAHHRRVAALLLRPLAACVARLQRMLHRHQHFLTARQSSCDVGDAEVRACVLTALHRTVQVRLRALAHAAATRNESRRGIKRKRPVKKKRAAYLSLRAFWWCAASQVEAQWRGSLAALEHRSGSRPSAHKDADASAAGEVTAAHLLRERGPASVHTRALKATQQLFNSSGGGASRTKAPRS